MPDSKKYLHPDAIRRISKLELRARHIVEGFLSGMHRSPYFGHSIEFRQHREYTSGDDLRHVDWKVWARQDRLYVKQFEEDTNMRCALLVDTSESMAFGNEPNKLDHAASIASCLAYLILRQQDAVGCITFDESIRQIAPMRSQHQHLTSIVHALQSQTARKKTRMDQVFAQVAEAFPRKGLMIVISDFFADLPSTLKGLRLLRQRGHDVLVFQVLHDDELEFPYAGQTRFEGLESAEDLACDPRALRDLYLQYLHEFLDEFRRGCAKNMVDYALVPTRQPLDVVLTHYLTHRLGMHRRN
jgi:uncharacterized protein (DUF58 family)